MITKHNHIYLLHIVQVLKTNIQNAVEHVTALWLLHQTLKKLHLGILCSRLQLKCDGTQ
jgi:hypothetical protein